jgi:hypothetical protein
VTGTIDRDALVARHVDGLTLALLLVGSHARGDAIPTSDIDLARHVAAPDDHGHVACHVDATGRLVTVKTLQVQQEAAALSRPGQAVWQVPTLRDAVILFDREGGAARLVAQARAFSWDAMAEAADRHVAGEVAHLAEEALKIAGGLEARRAAQVLYGTMGMVVGLAEAMVVHRRGFIDSENRLFDLALAAMDDEPQWQEAFRTAAGFAAAGPSDTGRAALALYETTARLLWPLLDRQERQVVEVGCQAAAAARSRSFGLPIS